MTEDDLKRLKHLPVPPPREGAKAAAVAAALVAFKAAAAHQDADAPQGSELLPRLRDTSVSEGSSRMRFRRPAAIAASIAVLAFAAVPLALHFLPRRDHMFYLVPPRKLAQEQPQEKVA